MRDMTIEEKNAREPVIIPTGILPTFDEFGYLRLQRDHAIGCYECKNGRELLMTILSSLDGYLVIVTCGICGRDVAKSEEVG